ncbi:ion channel TACAN-like [Paramacrobiotus metropolitanus]|uniref:ion channel TACAN-like n=1 Tax=Paramacrobiotus metropolitanus TaxID=2943436 RepID=UPI0024463666|nr:ion channel TACAN-like [Paramacrobiotus metropolitanus]
MSAGEAVVNLDSLAADLSALDEEFGKFEDQHRNYLLQLNQQVAAQAKCAKDYSHFKYRLAQINDALKKNGQNLSSEQAARLKELQEDIAVKRTQLNEIGETLPRKANIYLRTILGNVNLNLFSKADRFRYKDEYEQFKLAVTIVSTVLSFANLFLFKYRAMDALFHFLLVWYYCTLTIREGILRLNGSRIQVWWVAHHYITTVLTGILVTWPDTVIYQMFRTQFYIFSLYLGIVQVLQYRYQHGQLYKLKALGERKSMDVTVEGFHSWMWRGLGFLLPFLFGGYLFQLYNSYTLWQLAKDPRCLEWQVRTCAVIFFVLFLGNSLTTLSVMWKKMSRSSGPSKELDSRRLQAKYKST